MGYTHYWYQKVGKPFTKKEWQQITEGAKITFARAKRGLYAGEETAETAELTKTENLSLAKIGLPISFDMRSDFAEKGAWRTFAEPGRPTPEKGKPIEVAGGDGTGSPVITDAEIVFNGARENAYETFILDREPEQVEWRKGELEVFSCCKTEYRAYDAVVVSLLALAQTVAPNKIRVETDGDENTIRYLF